MKNKVVTAFVFFIFFASLKAFSANSFISFSAGDMLLNQNNEVNIFVDQNDCKGVMTAVRNMSTDINKVCGADVKISTNSNNAKIIVGTIGHSAAIDKIMKQRKNDMKQLKGKREMYVITIDNGQLVIAGSDRRGTIYGIYELSKQIGVSPWYYWADTPIEQHKHIYIKKGVYTDGEPAVRYRGIFLNDEAPCLTTWVKNTFGTEYGNHEFYAKVFELILRLKGNLLWPAMWGWAFYADDELNSKTADEMGVIIGTSHHEPMARNHQEWARNRDKYGKWNYNTNQEVLDKFFKEGIERRQGTEDIVTIGMRGDGDEAMSEESDVALLEKIIRNQRQIISDVTKQRADKTPQMWALYKEVMDYYDKGMKVPDDVTILLCDDNWGNVRRVPNAKEAKRAGGWGLYYHVDYVGAPRNSKWINVTPTQNMWEQLSLASEYGIDRIWILNVGDLKPMEYPISLFLDMAWNPKRYNETNITDHTLDFCKQQFGDEQAEEAARLLNLCCKYNGRITAEMLDRNTYNLETGEWEKVVNDYMKLEAEALRQFITLKDEYKDTYREIILFPIQAMGNLYQMYYAQAMNHKLYKNNDPDANKWADKVEEAFRRDSVLCAQYNHEIAGGKWNGMMIQKHIGYTSWNDDFEKDMLPEVFRIAENNAEGGFIHKASNGYAAIEAEHFYSKADAKDAKWTVIPFMGRTLSGISLRPYNKEVEGAGLTYKFVTDGKYTGDVKVYVIVKSTLDFLNKGGLTYNISIDGSEAKTINFNKDLNESPENIYTVYYPTVARRVVESIITLPLGKTSDNMHEIKITPNDPGIVFEKIVIDMGGYKNSYLHMKESEKFRTM